jgi:twitching motility protein PilT
MGHVMPVANHIFSSEEVDAILAPHLNQKQQADLEALRDVDFSLELKAEGLRFRANVFRQMTGQSAVFRIVKDRIPVLEELGLPPVVKSFAELKNGLVLVGGPTGSGKSTSLAGIIDHINRQSSRHIVTLEDPIEVMHRQKKCLINQRELGTHTHSFENALRATLRQDPDVILVGEMRDLATVQFAITASETGHLVLGTLHTVSVDTSVDRLVSLFPPGQQPQVRALLADTLRAVMCQYLVRRKDGQGRAIAVEIMLNNEAVANLIRKGKTFQIPSVIATQKDVGMQSMDSDLERLFRAGLISAEDAYMKAANKKNFELVIAGPDAGKDVK